MIASHTEVEELSPGVTVWLYYRPHSTAIGARKAILDGKYIKGYRGIVLAEIVNKVFSLGLKQQQGVKTPVIYFKNVFIDFPAKCGNMNKTNTDKTDRNSKG